jgi:hypothetical protein
LSLKNFTKKNHLNVVLFSISHFSVENYVATRFSPPQRENNQMVFFFFNIRFKSRLLKRGISLGKGELGWAFEFPYYLGEKKKIVFELKLQGTT